MFFSRTTEPEISLKSACIDAQDGLLEVRTDWKSFSNYKPQNEYMAFNSLTTRDESS